MQGFRCFELSLLNIGLFVHINHYWSIEMSWQKQIMLQPLQDCKIFERGKSPCCTLMNDYFKVTVNAEIK